jgi:hypothetical protein
MGEEAVLLAHFRRPAARTRSENSLLQVEQ